MNESTEENYADNLTVRIWKPWMHWFDLEILIVWWQSDGRSNHKKKAKATELVRNSLWFIHLASDWLSRTTEQHSRNNYTVQKE